MEHTTELKETTEEVAMKNPFPGLRPFKQEESHLFFGRENQTNEVLKRLIKNNFIAIIGNSGVGKSSFIKCGILPKLYADHPGLISNEWDVIEFRPGKNPISALANALAPELNEKTSGNGDSAPDINTIQEIFRANGSRGFNELTKNFIKASGKNLLIFIDQFEEIFRFKPDSDTVSDDVITFIDIILSSSLSKELPVYVVLTMRSDYIGECSKYPALTGAVNDSQFLIPQMTREEKKSAIIGPVKVMGERISDDLVNEILNRIGDDADQLPVMQHALMRSWDYWEENKIGKEEISLNHYKAIGGMETALSVHANEIFNSLPLKQRQACEKIFKSLTEKGEEGRSFRRPASVLELSHIAQTPTEQIKEIVDKFRLPGRTLLTPSHEVNLEDETIIDISHESLMRIWSTLSNWIDEEYESTKQYLRIAEAAEMHQSGKGRLLKSPELQMATNWYHSENPTKAWGIRHHIAYDRTIEYLLYSEKEFLREQRLKARQQKRRLLIARMIALVFGAGIMVASILFFYAQKQKKDATNMATVAAANAKEAEMQAENARLKSEEAERQTILAESEAEKARRSQKIADSERFKAINEAEKADKARKDAQTAEEEARKAEQDAYRQRMFSIARSMAVKSLEEPDTITKSLVSRQAYNFYYDNGGKGTEPDIYRAVYYAVKWIKGNDFNLLKGHTDNVRAIATSGISNNFYSTSSDGRIFKWNQAGHLKFNNTLITHKVENINKAMALSPDGKKLVVGGDYPYLLIYNTSNIKETPQKVKINSKQTWYIAFAPINNGIITVGSDKKIMLWDNISYIGKEIAIPQVKINSIDLDPSGRFLATGAENGSVVVYDLMNNFKSRVLYTEPKSVDISSLKYSENGRMLAIGMISGVVRILNPESGEILTSLTGHRAMVNQITFNHKADKLATASWDHTVRIWDLYNLYNPPVILDDHKDWVWSIGFSKNDDYLFAGCRDNLVRAWVMDIDNLALTICKEDRINRNLSDKEWTAYGADGIKKECSCIKNCKK